MIKDLLKNYESYTTEIAICNNFKRELNSELQQTMHDMDCLNKCIALLNKEEADIITAIYFEHKSIRTVANQYGYSKSGMQYKRDKIIDKLSRLYEKANNFS